FGPRPAAAHRLAHQRVVDFDIRPHVASMCKNRRKLCIGQIRADRDSGAADGELGRIRARMPALKVFWARAPPERSGRRRNFKRQD
ncbi:MAG TPA: hypothetical protein VD833_22015, partial [Vicinamibacterales bacterium]|nr:hypothetical protein [Vicinamibacterales bacterium]